MVIIKSDEDLLFLSRVQVAVMLRISLMTWQKVIKQLFWQAYKKQGQKAPKRELEVARKRLKEVLS